MNNKNYPAITILLLCMIFSCSFKNRILCGKWESILIENRSSFFSNTLPSSVRKEVLLTFNEDQKFTWVNESEKLNLSGHFSLSGNKIYFNITGEDKPLEVEFKLEKNRLIIITNDGFSFTFIKTD